jgi:hypothetical protein
LPANCRRWAWLQLVCVLLVFFGSDRIRHSFWSPKQPTTFRTLAVSALLASQPEVIFVGSSHIYTAVDPAQFTCPVVNLSDSGLNYQCAEMLCRHFDRSVKGARVVVIELDAVPVYQDTLALRGGDFRDFWEWGLTGWDLPASPWIRFSAEVSRQTGVGRWSPLVPQQIMEVAPADKVLGPGFKGRTDRLNPALKEEFFASLGTSFPQDVVETNIQSLITLVSRFQQTGVRVLLLRMPFHQDYWRHPSSSLRENYAEIALQRLRERSGSAMPEILDLRSALQLSDQSFSDWTHLSDAGARQLSRQLDALLAGSGTGGLQDHGDNPAAFASEGSAGSRSLP